MCERCAAHMLVPALGGQAKSIVSTTFTAAADLSVLLRRGTDASLRTKRRGRQDEDVNEDA